MEVQPKGKNWKQAHYFHSEVHIHPAKKNQSTLFICARAASCSASVTKIASNFSILKVSPWGNPCFLDSTSSLISLYFCEEYFKFNILMMGPLYTNHNQRFLHPENRVTCEVTVALRIQRRDESMITWGLDLEMKMVRAHVVPSENH